ncbi:MAG: dihydrodipicolinate synthase family protein [Candidatus Aminicenantes bacterium]|nr:dihydrodipicolinate synthase family protein [Candidatus Aminicenantes bacterium]
MSKRFEGIFAALTTPFVHEEASVPKFKENIAKFNETGLAGYLILGSTGESVSLSDVESEALVRAARESAAPGKKVIAGTARESTKLTLEFTNRAAGLGVDAALVRPPSYYKAKMNVDALRAYYLAVADGAKLPVIIYNIPQNTGIFLESQLIVELARHPNVIGLKESTGNLAFLGEVIRLVPPDFHYFLGSGSVFLPALELGACGAILAVANAAPEICVKIYKLFREGRLEEARSLQLDLLPFNKTIMEEAGIPGLKHALDLRGYYGGPARLPLLPVDEQTRSDLAAHMKRLGIL